MDCLCSDYDEYRCRTGGRRQTLSTTLYGKCLRLAVASILKVKCEAAKDVHAAEFEASGTGYEKRRAMRGYSQGIATMALWLRCAERLYLAVRVEYFLENVTRRIGAVLDYFVACRRPDERTFEVLK